MWLAGDQNPDATVKGFFGKRDERFRADFAEIKDAEGYGSAAFGIVTTEGCFGILKECCLLKLCERAGMFGRARTIAQSL
ncbi:MAG: hypothetical protein ACYDG4_00030 [Desulfuromonadaceae bacterium]